MANHGPVYGLDAELAAKRNASYDPAMEAQAREWIEGVTKGSLGGSFAEGLKDGVVLCNLINTIKPGTIKKINKMKMPFMQMENIEAFLAACRTWGVPATDLFQTVDLYEAKNMNQVVQAIHALGRTSRNIAGFNGPFIGPKLADKNERSFTEAQLRESESVVPMASRGSPGANQTGMYDTSRDIVRGAGAREATMGKNVSK